MIRNRLKTLIEEKAARDKRPGIPLNEIAKQLKISRNTLYLWLNKQDVGLYHADTLSALCEYFDCAVGDILEYVPDEPGVKA